LGSQNLHGAELTPIPTARYAGWQARAVWVAPNSPFAEAFRDLALRLREHLASEDGTSILVTSGLPGEGKTLTACNLALALASFATSERVALVDFDLRLPGVAPALGLRPQLGIEAVLRSELPLEAVAIVTDARVHVYPVAEPEKAAHELLARSELSDVLKRLESTYRWVICDSPPLLLVPDAQLIAPHVGACLAVVRAGTTPRNALKELAGRLPKDRTVGFFLNEGRPPSHTSRYYRSSYYGSRSSAKAWESSS
jgi:Mrp family chromosome partitioning ATPase